MYRLSGKCLQTLEGHSDEVLSVSFSPDGTKIVSGGRRRRGEAVGCCEWGVSADAGGHSDYVSSNPVSFFSDGTKIASGYDTEVTLWEVTSGELLHTYERHSGRVQSVSFFSRRI